MSYTSKFDDNSEWWQTQKDKIMRQYQIQQFKVRIVNKHQNEDGPSFGNIIHYIHRWIRLVLLIK